MANFENLVDVYHNSIKTYPDRELFGTKQNGQWNWLSYLDFGKKVDKFRAALADLGLTKGDRLALIANNRVEWAVTAWACIGLGIVYVPMYEQQNAKEWEFIIKDSGAKAVVGATDKIVEKIKGFESLQSVVTILISFDPATKTDGRVKSYTELMETAKKGPTASLNAEDTACFIYTSGTTGNPKGVVLSHGNLATNIAAIHTKMPMRSTDRTLSFLPWAHVLGQTCELYGVFSLGGSLAICEGVDKLLENLAEVRPTILVSVPRVFNKLYVAVQKTISSKPGFVQKLVSVALETRRKQRDGEEVGIGEGLVTSLADKLVFEKVRARFGGRLEYAFSGGAALSKDVAEFIDSIGVTVYEGYGLTETSPIVSANSPSGRKIGSIGKVFPGISVMTTDDGELCVSGPNVMKGYHDRPEENAAVFFEKDGKKWFRTGDMARIDPDGFIWIIGRIKEQYKLENGKYVVPTPLEERLKLSPFVANIFVYGDNRPFNVALAVPNFDAVQSWGAENGVSETDPKKLIANPKVRALFQAELDEWGKAFKGFEGIKDFDLIPEDFTTENGMLTPSLKLKRRKVVEEYQGVLDALYTKKKSAGAKDEANA